MDIQKQRKNKRRLLLDATEKLNTKNSTIPIMLNLLNASLIEDAKSANQYFLPKQKTANLYINNKI
jgi:hypothetical protein